jgi:hypothetical protein
MGLQFNAPIKIGFMADWFTHDRSSSALGSLLLIVDMAALPPSNAAPEWQAGSLRWRSSELRAACPLEGLVRTAEYLAVPTRKILGLG